MNSVIKVLPNNPELEGQASFIPDVVFSVATGTELKLHLLMPWKDPADDVPKKKSPLIVFLQGSAWTFPNVNYEVLQLAEYARMGYVVATITHRSALNGHPAPAFLMDAKTAIRFLWKNAELYGIDPERIAFWGTSSGGNTALLVALTGDNPAYKSDEYADISDRVKAVVDCFGPTDLTRLFDAGGSPSQEVEALVRQFLGADPDEQKKLALEMSPLYRIEHAKEIPPILLLHGDADSLVRFEQSEWMYQALLQHRQDVEMIRVENAPHEGSFWSRALHMEIMDFLKRRL